MGAREAPSLFVSFDCDSSSEEYVGRYESFSSGSYSAGVSGQSRVCRARESLLARWGRKKCPSKNSIH